MITITLKTLKDVDDLKAVCQCGKCKTPTEVSGNFNKIKEVLKLAFTTGFFQSPVIYVTSTYRCPEHNKKVGGSPTSLHTKGMAIDMVFEVRNCGKEYLVPVEVTQFFLEQFSGFEENEIIVYEKGRVHFGLKRNKYRKNERK